MSGIKSRSVRGSYGEKSVRIMQKAKERGMCLLDNGGIKLPTGKIHIGTPQWGRDRINLSVDGERITIATARVICFLAHGLPNSLNDVVDHIDGDTLNDAPSNLRWATYSQNTRNTKYYRNKTWEQKAIEACAGMKDPKAEIATLKVQRDELLAEVGEWRAIKAAYLIEYAARPNAFHPGQYHGHAHDIDGIWDRDNGVLAGCKCVACMVHRAAIANAEK